MPKTAKNTLFLKNDIRCSLFHRGLKNKNYPIKTVKMQKTSLDQ